MAAQPGAQAGWMQPEAHLKMAAGPTVNLLATAGSGHVAPPAFSPASSPFAHGSSASSRSSPAFISRTGSGVSEDAGAGGPDLTAAALQALGRQASLAAAAAAAGSPTSGASGSPHGASTPHPAPGRSNLGPAGPAGQQAAELEASMQGACMGVAAFWVGMAGRLALLARMLSRLQTALVPEFALRGRLLSAPPLPKHSQPPTPCACCPDVSSGRRPVHQHRQGTALLLCPWRCAHACGGVCSLPPGVGRGGAAVQGRQW